MKVPRLRLWLATGLVAVTGAVGALTAPAAHAATGCRVDYSVTNQWPGGFGANVSITNLGDPINGWRLSWSFSAGQTITQLWNGSMTQSGAQVTVADAGYNGALATGASTSFGFNGASSGANPVPASFTLNGTACTGGVNASPSSPASPSVSPSAGPSSPGTSSKPCDLYAAGGTPCVAAHSTTRALYRSYTGNLYQVRRSSDNATRNIAVLAAGGVANAAAQDSFCAGTTCVITVVYDQSGRGNDLWYQGPGGAGGRDTPATATSESLTVGGSKAYSLYIK
ncbi:arabinofuranosidase catalytic domain-containing protein, partial [Microbispora sp. ZYX-F-249]